MSASRGAKCLLHSAAHTPAMPAAALVPEAVALTPQILGQDDAVHVVGSTAFAGMLHGAEEYLVTMTWHTGASRFSDDWVVTDEMPSDFSCWVESYK